jgi:hypothetical protein
MKEICHFFGKGLDKIWIRYYTETMTETMIKKAKLVAYKTGRSLSANFVRKCPECGKALKNPQALNGHLRFKHGRRLVTRVGVLSKTVGRLEKGGRMSVGEDGCVT